MGQFTYRRKPGLVEAWCNMPQFEDDQPDWLQIARQNAEVVRHPVVPGALSLLNPSGTLRADRGHWIVRSNTGELYPVETDEFETLYEKAEGDEVEELYLRRADADEEAQLARAGELEAEREAVREANRPLEEAAAVAAAETDDEPDNGFEESED